MKLLFVALVTIMMICPGCVFQKTTEENAHVENAPEITENETADTPISPNVFPERSNGSQSGLDNAARDFASNTSTYAYDGINLTLEKNSNGVFEFSFVSKNSGYGDRSGDLSDDRMTSHKMTIKYNGSEFYSAVVDDKYDEIHSILFSDICPAEYRRYLWENDSFCYKPSATDGFPCAFSHQCVKGGCIMKSSGNMGPRGICSDYIYGCHSWLYDQQITKIDKCIEKDYP